MFKGILLTQNGRDTQAVLTGLDDSQLPDGDVDVDVEWSTLNYKDGLAITGQGPVVRTWPMVPGHRFRRRGARQPPPGGGGRDTRRADWLGPR